MPTGSEPVPDIHYAGPAGEWVELMRERDELRIENIRLRAENGELRGRLARFDAHEEARQRALDL